MRPVLIIARVPLANEHVGPRPGRYVWNMIGGGVLLMLIYFIVVLVMA